MFQRIFTPALSRLSLAGVLAIALTAPALAQDKAAAPAAPAASTAPAAAAEQAAPAKKKRRKSDGRSGRNGLARVSGSLEQRHQVCLAFIRRHNLDCDPWQTPTCGAETGYFRPPECVRPRSQQ
ncbi:MAG: hypothetical protein U1E30_08500 [Rhodoblastus sp.]